MATSAAWSTAPASPWPPWTRSCCTAASPPTSSTSAPSTASTASISALRIIQQDPDVKAILINIFGGLARVDIVAEGVVAAVKQLRITQPIIVRLNGSNVEEGRKILIESDITVESADELAEASRLAVAAAAQQQ